MAILSDGMIGTVGALISGSQDSNGKTLHFKLNEETGSYEAQGTDKIKYFVDPETATAKVSTLNLEVKEAKEKKQKEEEEEAAKAAASAPAAGKATTTTAAKK